MIQFLYDPLLTLIYPQECRICGNSVERQSDGSACEECWRKVRFYGRGEGKCDKCGAYFGESAGAAKRCGQCGDHFYDKAAAAGVYEFGLAAVIIGLKSEPHIPARCSPLLLTTYKREKLQDASMIVPIPLSEKRRIERGYNQAEVLAGSLSAATGKPVRTDILTRRLHTPMHRAAMDEKARHLTVDKAFEVASDATLKDQHVLLVDDVLTSGATASACAKILKKHGAKRVDVLTLARAIYRS